MNPLYAKMLAEKIKGNPTQTGLPAWAKGVIAVTLIGAGVFVAYKIYKFIEGKDREEKKNAEDVIKEQDKEIKNEIKNGETPSKPLSTYKSTANTIFELLDGCELLASEIKVVQEVVKQVKKPLDWKILSREFGVRKVDDCGPWGETTYELGNLLKTELDAKVSTTMVVADGYTYNPIKSGAKTTFEILNIYLRKIGVTI